jgi:hypothetical protein
VSPTVRAANNCPRCVTGAADPVIATPVAVVHSAARVGVLKIH